MSIERKREYIISGSIDIQVEIEPMEFDDMVNRQPAESSAKIRARVMAALVDGRHIAEAIGYRALDRIQNFGIADAKSSARIPKK